MKVAVLGATGMLGSMLVDYLSEFYNIVAISRSNTLTPINNVEDRQFDAIKSEDSQLKKVVEDCDWIINAIGSIPQRCNDTQEMILTNAFFPSRLTEVGKPVIQITTDCVYSGRKGNYVETDKYDVVKSDRDSNYGFTKQDGEICGFGLNQIRCSVVGPESHGKSLLGWFLSQPEKTIINGYRNHIWNGVTTLHFAKICRGIIENDIKLGQKIHLLPADVVTKYELLVDFAREFNRGDITIVSVDALTAINRSLATIYPGANKYLWECAGYMEPPTIRQMIKELAEYVQ